MYKNTAKSPVDGILPLRLCLISYGNFIGNQKSPVWHGDKWDRWVTHKAATSLMDLLKANKINKKYKNGFHRSMSSVSCSLGDNCWRHVWKRKLSGRCKMPPGGKVRKEPFPCKMPSLQIGRYRKSDRIYFIQILQIVQNKLCFVAKCYRCKTLVASCVYVAKSSLPNAQRCKMVVAKCPPTGNGRFFFKYYKMFQKDDIFPLLYI